MLPDAILSLLQDEKALARTELAPKGQRPPWGKATACGCHEQESNGGSQEGTSSPRKKWEVAPRLSHEPCASFLGHTCSALAGERGFFMTGRLLPYLPHYLCENVPRKLYFGRSGCFRNLKALKNYSGRATPYPVDSTYCSSQHFKCIMSLNIHSNPLRWIL